MATKSISVERPDKKNRTRLTDLEGLAQALLRSAGLGIYIVQEGKFQYVNPLFQGLTGYTEEELLGTYSLNLVHPEDRETVRRKALENLRGQVAYPYEYRLIKKDGGLMWVLENIAAAEYKGRPAAVGSFTDIAERKEAEEALRESQERYSQLYENINEAVAFYRFPDLKISHWNKCYEDLHKLLSAKDPENMTLSDIAAMVEDDDWDRAMEGMAETLAGEPMPDADVLEIKMKDLEGKRRVLEVKSTLYKEKDQVVGVQVAMADITERKRQQDQLMKQAGELRERNRELNCLYQISEIVRGGEVSLEGTLQKIVEAIPLAWQYPDEACARIVLDAQTFTSKNFTETAWKQASEIVVHDKSAGALEVYYLKELPVHDEGPFLKSERSLIDSLAERISRITERKQAQEALKESEERYRGLFENANDLIQSVNPSGKFTYVNRKWLEVLQYTKDEVENLTLWDVLRRDQIPHCMELFKRVSSGKDVTGTEIVFISKSGKEVYVEGNVNPRFQNGEFVATQGIFRNITERKEAEEALRESQEMYMRLYEGLNEAVSFYRLPDLKISHWNKRYEDIHKLILTKEIEDVTISDIAPVVEADDRERVMEGFAKTLAGEPVPDVDVYEVRMEDLEGKRRVLEIRPSFYREEDQVVGIQVAMADITERKRAEEALRESEELFRSLFNAMSEGVFLMDTDGQILQVNPAAKYFLGLRHSESREPISNPLHVEVIHPDGSPMLPEEIPGFRVIKEKRPVRADLTGIKHPDGTNFWFIVNAIPLFGSNNELSGVLTTFTDITERKQAGEEREALLRDIKEINRKLEESNNELQDFAYIASHDLREPLRKISSFGALLQDSLQGKLDEDQQENFGFMIDGAQRMQEMIDDLLTYSRLTTRAKPPQRVDLNEVIEELEKLELATLLDETQGTIRVPQPLPPVQADLSQMHQLFQNLIGNGLKFHKKGIPPEITIRARQVENNMIQIEVEDNGIGIDGEYYEQIFVMFKRLHSREQYEGTGIGLAACKKIVERHGGNIGVKSTPGGGSTFWFTLPRGSYSGDS